MGVCARCMRAICVDMRECVYVCNVSDFLSPQTIIFFTSVTQKCVTTGGHRTRA